MFSNDEWTLILGYLTLAAAILFELGFVMVMRQRARAGEAIHLVLVYQLALMLSCTVTVAVGPWSYFNVLWLLPACVVASFLLFALFAVPLLGTALRAVGMTWAKMFLLGIDATVIGGNPGSRL
jgi:hypothetical protein